VTLSSMLVVVSPRKREALLRCRPIDRPTLNYSGIPRHADRQQIEFCILALIRVSRLLSALLPKRVHDARPIGQ
jgi:hypothetical protein